MAPDSLQYQSIKNNNYINKLASILYISKNYEKRRYSYWYDIFSFIVITALSSAKFILIRVLFGLVI